MSYDFSTSVDRADSNAEKYRLREELFGTEDVLPVWVADMDLHTPSFVLEAVKKRLEHPVIGYEEVPKSAFEAQIAWLQSEHKLSFSVEELLYSHSVVASMAVAIEAFTQKGEGVIVQTPVYSPFFHSVLNLERELVKNPLSLSTSGEYSFNIEDLEQKIKPSTKLLLLCSPHNPVGRVWRREELEAILALCLKHNIVVFSDEIHSDLVYAPHKHIPFVSLSEEAKRITVTAVGVGKTFNMAGFAMSSVAIADKALLAQYKKAYERVHFAQGCVLSHVAFEAAYREGKEFKESLLLHLHKNYKALEALAQEYSEFLSLTPIEATYLAWLDCRKMGLKDKELRTFFVQEAKLGLNAGISFGREGSGYMRLNFAISSARMSEVIQRLQKAFEKRRKSIGKN